MYSHISSCSTLGITVLAFIIAEAVPFFSYLIGLIGSLCCAPTCVSTVLTTVNQFTDHSVCFVACHSGIHGSVHGQGQIYFEPKEDGDLCSSCLHYRPRRVRYRCRNVYDDSEHC